MQSFSSRQINVKKETKTKKPFVLLLIATTCLLEEYELLFFGGLSIYLILSNSRLVRHLFASRQLMSSRIFLPNQLVELSTFSSIDLPLWLICQAWGFSFVAPTHTSKTFQNSHFKIKIYIFFSVTEPGNRVTWDEEVVK